MIHSPSPLSTSTICSNTSVCSGLDFYKSNKSELSYLNQYNTLKLYKQIYTEDVAFILKIYKDVLSFFQNKNEPAIELHPFYPLYNFLSNSITVCSP